MAPPLRGPKRLFGPLNCRLNRAIPHCLFSLPFLPPSPPACMLHLGFAQPPTMIIIITPWTAARPRAPHELPCSLILFHT